MDTRFFSVLVVVSLLFVPLVAAEETRSDFDTIDNAPEEKERASLSDADAKKALEGFSSRISDIKVSLERCETDICRQVSANADKRAGLVMRAQEDVDNADGYVEEVRTIVREDIATLEKCGTDVCRDVLSQEKELLASVGDFLDADSDGDGISDAVESDAGDLDGDGYGDVALQGENVSLCCFDYSRVSRIHEESTVGGSSALYEPDRTVQTSDGGGSGKVSIRTLEDIYPPNTSLQISTGGGAGKASFNDIKLAVCPEDDCPVGVVDINVENQPPVAIVFESGFATQENILGIDKKEIRLTLSDAICSQEQNEIICTNEDQQLAVVFETDTDVSCAVPGVENDPALKKPRWMTNSTQEKSDGEGQVYCWGKNERSSQNVQLAFTHAQDGIDTEDIRREVGSDDCDDTDCPAAPEADVNGEIILGEDRDMVLSSCPDDACVVDVAERCGDDVCLASVAEHCRDEKCVAEVAGKCSDGICMADVASICPDEKCVAEVAAKCGDDICVARVASVCPDEKCVAGVAAHCSDDICREQAREHCSGGICTPAMRDGGIDKASPYIAQGLERDDDGTRAMRRIDQTTPLLMTGMRPSDLDEDDKEGIGAYLRSQTELRGADFGLAVAYTMSNDSRVRSVRYDNATNTVHIEHQERARLFGFIPVEARVRTTMNDQGDVDTKRPWWSFLAATENSVKFKAGAELSKAVN